MAKLVTGYRARFGVEGDDPLGRPPLEAFQRAAYESTAAELRVYERRLGRTREVPGLERVGPDLGRGR